MSIIYDALKKVEESNVKEIKPQAEPSEHHKRSFKTYLLYGLAACVGLFVINLFFSFLTHPKQGAKAERLNPAPVFKEQTPPALQTQAAIQAKPSAQQPSQQEAPKATAVRMSSKGLLILNGIFFSENEGYALVNNHIVKVGDTVNSATVKSITVDEVELEADGESVKLTTAQR